MLISTYLTCINNFHDKFYELAINDSSNIVYLRYGKNGTTGDSYIKTFVSPREAIKFYSRQLHSKLRKGYEKQPSRPTNAPPFPEELTRHNQTVSDETKSPEPENSSANAVGFKPKDYTMTWLTSKPLEPTHIQQAFDVTTRLLDLLKEHFPDTTLQIGSDGLGPFVRFAEGSRGLSIFGFPPTSFLDSLHPKERRRMQSGGNGGTEIKGWLNCKGEGRGLIYTYMKKTDFFIRTFLSVLQVKADLRVNCRLGLDTSGKGLYVSDDFHVFEWYPLWRETIYPVARRIWLIHGESIFLPIEQKPNTGLPARVVW